MHAHEKVSSAAVEFPSQPTSDPGGRGDGETRQWDTVDMTCLLPLSALSTAPRSVISGLNFFWWQILLDDVPDRSLICSRYFHQSVRLLVECDSSQSGSRCAGVYVLPVHNQWQSPPSPPYPERPLVPLVLDRGKGSCVRYGAVLIIQLELKLSLLAEPVHRPYIESSELATAVVAITGKQELEKPCCQSTNLGGRERCTRTVRRFSVAWCLVG